MRETSKEIEQITITLEKLGKLKHAAVVLPERLILEEQSWK